MQTNSTQETTQLLDTSIGHLEKALSLFERLEADQDFKIERFHGPPSCRMTSHSPLKKTPSRPLSNAESEEEDEEDGDDAKVVLEEKREDEEEAKLKKAKWFNLPPILKSNDGKSQLSSQTSKTGTGIGAPFDPFHHLRVLLAKK
jgi:hypothetical protein